MSNDETEPKGTVMVEVPKHLAPLIPDLINTAVAFERSFRLVFHDDWEFSKGNLSDRFIDCFISKAGTFIAPNCGDEGNNWGNRGGLLASYRVFADVLLKVQAGGCGSE